MLLEHPAVVGEEQLEAEAQSQDDGEPQHGAEDQCRQHGLALRAQRHMQAAREREDYFFILYIIFIYSIL